MKAGSGSLIGYLAGANLIRSFHSKWIISFIHAISLSNKILIIPGTIYSHCLRAKILELGKPVYHLFLRLLCAFASFHVVISVRLCQMYHLSPCLCHQIKSNFNSYEVPVSVLLYRHCSSHDDCMSWLKYSKTFWHDCLMVDTVNQKHVAGIFCKQHLAYCHFDRTVFSLSDAAHISLLLSLSKLSIDRH